jgi:hypothetical protein
VKTFQRITIALVGAALLAGCGARGVRIAELKTQPTKYQDKTVSISGTVTDSWGIPLVPFQFYRIDDGSGDIAVVSHAGRAPAKGARVQVKGKVTEVATFGGQQFGLHLEETDRSTP